MESKVDYKKLMNQALCSVIRSALYSFARSGAVGLNLVISFKTNFRGVTVPSYLKQSYPDEMTVVLQHKYSNLVVSGHDFCITLTFRGVDEKITVPFLAISKYMDVNNDFSVALTPNESNGDADLNEEEDSAIPVPVDDKVIFIDQFRKK